MPTKPTTGDRAGYDPAGPTASADPLAPNGTPAASILEQARAAFPELEIIEVIGRGGMGVVFRARQRNLDRLVALKVLPQNLAAQPEFTERFNREARVLARLSHPNIVNIYDFGQSEGLYYLLMEFVPGSNLRQAMHAGRLKPREALAIVTQVCEALQYAHDKGVLHRDIKPENILLDLAGRVKIADFGIAKLVGDGVPQGKLTGTGATLGTPHYMAPEQFETPTRVDHRADIYSLGVVFYEMLTGELPLGRFAPPSDKARLDVRIDEIVLRALARERESRPCHPSRSGAVRTRTGPRPGRNQHPGRGESPAHLCTKKRGRGPDLTHPGPGVRGGNCPGRS